ncbi:MAG: protein-L-isoaspartate(D-aspartate) O-methyltransferase [Chloroflexi bacterium]|nr:protein-L-isoaspartate(D-aspartate) O-methyltransferase [Chloroflexota bacterium]
MFDPSPFSEQRLRMVAEQIERRGIHDPRLLEAMRWVPRHLFVDPEFQEAAYEDCPLPIGNGQTISQPYIVALMTHLLRLKGSETVLEVGTGSGYQAAILGLLARQVFTLEVYPALAEAAARLLAELKLTNVEVRVADGSLGLPEKAPYQGILVTAAAPCAPGPLLEQLGSGGRLVIPVGARGNQDLQLWQHKGTRFFSKDIAPVAFVPLRGSLGWKENEWR